MTVEEKAEEYGQMVAEGTGIIDFKHVSTNAYMDGYNEAMRCIDQKEELPEEAGCDFCRDEQGYTIGNMYVCDKCGRQVP